MREFIIIAHRGASAYSQENSKLAIENAYKLGADGVEVDVRKTKDGKIICYHDKDLRKYEINKLISQVSYSEIHSIDKDIPKIEELFDVFKLFKYVFLDVKEKEEVESLLNIINGISNIVLVTGYIDVLQKIREINSRIPLGFWFYRPINIDDIISFNISYIKPMFKIATKELINKSHDLGKKVLVWTVDDPKLAKLFYDEGADGIVTDQPDVIKSAIEKYINEQNKSNNG